MKMFSTGTLLSTKQTRKWSEYQKSKYQEVEECKVFLNFSELDEGRSRILVAECPDPETAKIVCDSFNFLVSKKSRAFLETRGLSDRIRKHFGV